MIFFSGFENDLLASSFVSPENDANGNECISPGLSKNQWVLLGCVLSIAMSVIIIVASTVIGASFYLLMRRAERNWSFHSIRRPRRLKRLKRQLLLGSETLTENSKKTAKKYHRSFPNISRWISLTSIPETFTHIEDVENQIDQKTTHYFLKNEELQSLFPDRCLKHSAVTSYGTISDSTQNVGRCTENQDLITFKGSP